MKAVALAILALGVTSVAFARGGNNGADSLTRNSSAWQLKEASEFALRTLVSQDASWIANVVGVDTWREGATVFAEVERADGVVARFSCAMVQDLSQGGTVVRDELRCASIP